jgi:hypothetical protein
MVPEKGASEDDESEEEGPVGAGKSQPINTSRARK